MGNSEYSASDLVAMSGDYFAANPDVEHLVAVVGTGTFYRPERESIAKDEARVAQSTTMRILRSPLAAPAVAPSVDAEVPEFPAVVGTLELLLAEVKLVGALPRQLAEVIYQAALAEADPAVMLENVADFLMTALANGLDTITYNPKPVPMLTAAPFVAIVDNSGAQVGKLASLANQGLLKLAADESAPSLADVVAGGKLFVFAPSAPAAAAKAAPGAKPAKAKPAPAAKPAKEKAAPKKKASTVAKAA
ncbi:hypothetical protein QMK33_00300 [Hymenobacter sp. H14-R3]|uniref:hypothetical protein n=1 Tax=Hymenobacter sp. H14-R3 TaxID=3046308 RepID=UPI0024B8C569|nr:hypothetical protein [Hymenobacter sp. H14-R3]MDJ0363574.1 hypothetical protein [Hymenobacter sp. H14-R3]